LTDLCTPFPEVQTSKQEKVKLEETNLTCIKTFTQLLGKITLASVVCDNMYVIPHSPRQNMKDFQPDFQQMPNPNIQTIYFIEILGCGNITSTGCALYAYCYQLMTEIYIFF
jgi:hypothetical protein